MVCPHCGYEGGHYGRYDKWIEGKEGVFYSLSNGVKMERTPLWLDKETWDLYGCPKCRGVFID